MDEIPVAQREVNPDKKMARIPSNIILIFSAGLIFLVAIWFFWGNNTQTANQNNSQPVITTNNPLSNTDIEEQNTNVAIDEVKQEPTPEHILGHLPYPEAKVEELKNITSDGRIRLKSKAAEKFQQMQEDARRQGILLTSLSGFRTIAEQEYLFFEIKAQRQQDASTRAEVSAPPGYSEHHTGYAIDIGDGNSPATNLETSFDQTAAYQWLSRNASRYSFELSFPKDNLQGISYEPWHWRYVGDSSSLETFYKVHQLTTNLQK